MNNINELSLFSLFHHNINYQSKLFKFDTDKLLELSKKNNKEYNIDDIKNTLTKVVINNISGLKDSEISLTLTGGMDSRIILAILLKEGVKPNCFTFGNPQANDVIFSKHIADKYNLPYQNVCQLSPNKDWYYKWVVETIKINTGNSHIHRAHRTAAIAEHVSIYKPKVLFTGHMGGEGIRGLTYNNYFSSTFFKNVNEKKGQPNVIIEDVLKSYFINIRSLNINELWESILKLPWMNNDNITNKFYFLYDLVAKIHHEQDLIIYKNFVDNVVPVYLDNEYLNILFASSYNFLSKSGNTFSRLKNPELYCNLLYRIYPSLLKDQFSNGFRPDEYLKGMWYYVPVKTFRKFRKNKNIVPTFSYGNWYKEFVLEHSKEISENIWKIYNKDEYFNALNASRHKTDEGYWHKFSNPIYFDLVEKFKQGLTI